ncbi:FAD-dependent oxidoreductase [Cytobacillus sp. S13-E01]|uniref:NAD(P)/FAD-dependent oxidoreductase n=1 Tax=Cytobacillus sp. S13-E01 TaxID=3031326 RepID=UPI0023D7C8FD|nr:FAD-dependent oxidoreductase [Cytobacillus sp. S13-E01]MDF0727726.1 FAD-dependent oxidoreductase [Cytobacillus sp. S13-E01]
MAKIIIAGGGFGGIVAAQSLRNELGNEHDILLISNLDKFYMRAAFPGVALGHINPEEIVLSLPELLHKRNIDFLAGEIEKVDPKEQKVYSSDQTIDYDYLVMAMGAHFAYEKIPGFKDYGHSLQTIDMALKLRKAISSFKGGTFVAGVAQNSPCEGPALEVLFQLDHYLREKGKRDQTEFHYFTAKPVAFAPGGPVVQDFVKEQFEKHNIHLHVNVELSEIAENEVRFKDGHALESQLSFIMPAYEGPKGLQGSGLVGEGGFVPVNEQLRSVHYPNVFATGDMIQMVGPKMGHNAMAGAKVIARNIAHELRVSNANALYTPEVLCVMEMGGDNAAYIEADTIWGGTRSKVPVTGPVAAFMKKSFKEYFVREQGNIDYIL